MQKINRYYRASYDGEHMTTRMTWEDGQWKLEKEFIPNRVVNTQISKQAVVIGNGSSREGFELFHLNNPLIGLFGAKAVQTYGCNALYRDFKPTFLIATGAEIAQEIVDSGYCDDNIVYANSGTVARYPGKFYLVPQDPHYNSGTLAAYLACFDGHEKVYLCGFDGETGANMYADTPCYQPNNDTVNDVFWNKAMLQIMTLYPDTEFIRVVPNDGYSCPTEWLSLPNFRQISNQKFHIEINAN
jgi:hypothetical protein